MTMTTKIALALRQSGKRACRCLPLLAASLLSACAGYTPKPLDSSASVLAPPNATLLSTDARQLDRPDLAPQPLDFARPLTPGALAIIAVLRNPDLRAQRVRLGVTDAQSFAARLLPDPQVQGNYTWLLAGPDAFNAYAAQLALDINAIRTAAVVKRIGAANKRQVRLDLAWAEWQASCQARLLGARIPSLEGQLAIVRVSVAAAERLFAATRGAAGRGDLAGGETDTRRQALLDAVTRLRTTENDLATARSDLNKLLGLPPEMQLRIAPLALPPSPPPAAVLIAQAIDRRLDLQALPAGYASAEASLHKAVLDQFPALQIGSAGARDTSDNFTAGPGIQFTLPLWNRNRGGIAVAKATREQLRAEYDARLLLTRAEIGASEIGLAIARRQRATLGIELPALQRYADATRRAQARGDLAPATAETAAQALRDRNLTLLQIDQQIAEQTIALELLSGGPSEGWMR